MASLVIQYLTPPMPDVSGDYDGLEYRWKFLTFRPACEFGLLSLPTQRDSYHTSDFKNEVYFLGAVLLYAVCYFIGKKANERRANKWCVLCYVGAVVLIKRYSIVGSRHTYPCTRPSFLDQRTARASYRVRGPILHPSHPLKSASDPFRWEQ